MLVICTLEYVLPHVSSSRLASCSMREGACLLELSSSSRSCMKIEMSGLRKRATGLPRNLSLSFWSSVASAVLEFRLAGVPLCLPFWSSVAS